MVDLRPFAWLVDLRSALYVDSDADPFVWSRGFLPLPSAGPTIVELAATSAGVATVTGTLTAIVPLTGTSDGVATVTGSLTAENVNELAGTTNGTSTVTGNLSQVHDLASTPAGTSTVTGTLFQVNELTASSDGVGSITGKLYEPFEYIRLKPPFLIPEELSVEPINELSGTIAGTSTVSVDPDPVGITEFPIPYQVGYGGQGVDELSAIPITGTSTVTGNLYVIKELSGQSDGTSIVRVVSETSEWWHKMDVPSSGPSLTGSIANDGYGGSASDVLNYTNAPFSQGRFGTALGDLVDSTDIADGSSAYFAPLEFTISVWVRTTAVGPGGNIQVIMDNGSLAINVSFYLNSTNNIQFEVQLDGVNNAGSLLSSSAVSIDEWHHIVVSYRSGLQRLYLDGVLEDENSHTYSSVGWSGYLRWGGQIKSSNRAGRYFRGKIDQIKLWAYALEGIELDNLLNDTGNGFINALEWDLVETASAGSSTVTGYLEVGDDDANGNVIIELVATPITGVATVTTLGFQVFRHVDDTPGNPVIGIDFEPSTYLYQQVNVGMGFDDIDDASGLIGFVSQTYPDGDTDLDFDRYLYQQVNVGFGFEDIDDISARADFVSQTYPDGHTELDFDRYLYQQIQVILGIDGNNDRLIVRPGRNDKLPVVPSPRPPSGKLS